MGIYDDGYRPAINLPDLGKLVKPLLGLMVLVVLYLAVVNVQEMLKQKPLEIRLEKNTIQADETTRLNVKVSNTTGKDASEVVLLVKAKDDRSINITPLTTNLIKQLPANEWRQLDFLVNPIGSISPGGYTLTVETIVNDQKFGESAVIRVEE